MAGKLSLRHEPGVVLNDVIEKPKSGSPVGSDRPRKNGRRARTLRSVLGVLSLAAALGAATYYFSQLEQADPVVKESTLWIDTVRRGEMIRNVRANGTLIPREIRWVPAPSDGRVERILVRNGEHAEPDTVLLVVDNPVLERDVLDAQWQLNAAEAELRNLIAQLDTQMLDRKDAATILDAELRVATLENGRNQQLFDSGLLAQHELDVSRGKVEELKTRHEILLNHMRTVEQSRDAQLAVQQAKVEQLRGLLELRQRQVDDLHVKAGIAGVVQQVFVEEGQQISPAVNLAKIARPEELKAELRVAEAQMRDVTVGQVVEIDTRSGKVAGRVERIDPAVEEGTVAVDVTIEGPLPAVARPDLTVDGLIELERIPDALYTGKPVMAVAGSTVELFRVTPDGRAADRVPVRIGKTSVTDAEILEGLEEGDRVIVSDTSKWQLVDRLRLE